MASISRIVNVQIALAPAGLKQKGFSDILLVGAHASPDRVSVITDAGDLLDAPFSLLETNPLYKAALVAFSQQPCVNRLFIGRRDTGESANAVLAACATANDEWYGVAFVDHLEADLLGAAAWCEANRRLFCAVITDPDVAAASGAEPATGLMTGNFFRTAWWYHTDAAAFPEVAAMAKGFVTPPGGGGSGVTIGGTFANMRLRAVPHTNLTETQYINIKNKNGNTIEPFTNISITQGGKTAGGEWIDIIRGIDWLCEEMRINVFRLFIDRRLPFTDQGIAAIGQRMDQSLSLAVRNGFVAPREIDLDTEKEIPSYVITLPRSIQVPQNDKANRVLNNCRFEARIAGAIHATTIFGSLTYDPISSAQ